MKKLITNLLLISSLLVVLEAKAQTNSNSGSGLGALLNGTNYWVLPGGTMAADGKSFGGFIAVGYDATPALAPVVRLDYFAGQVYLANISLQLQAPQSFMGKIPILPMIEAGAGTPLTTTVIDNGFSISAGNPVGIVGTGARVNLNWVGSGTFWQQSFLYGSYEHWTGAGIPSNQQNQFRFGLGYHF